MLKLGNGGAWGPQECRALARLPYSLTQLVCIASPTVRQRLWYALGIQQETAPGSPLFSWN